MQCLRLNVVAVVHGDATNLVIIDKVQHSIVRLIHHRLGPGVVEEGLQFQPSVSIVGQLPLLLLLVRLQCKHVLAGGGHRHHGFIDNVALLHDYIQPMAAIGPADERY